MANVWAIKTGDWSDTTLWNTGVLPTSADNVYANNFNININQNISVISIRITSNTGVAAGGKYIFNTGGITANISDNIYFPDSTNMITVSASSGTVIINLPLATITPGNANTIISYSGNCNLTITALRINGGTSPFNSRCVLSKTSTGILTVNSEVTGGGNGDSSSYIPFLLNSNSLNYFNGNIVGGSSSAANGGIAISLFFGTLVINGNVTGGNGSLGNSGTIYCAAGAVSLTISGNVAGNTSKAVYAIAGTVNITGTITGSNTAGIAGVDIAGTAILNHVGTAQASLSASAITCYTPTTSTVICTGPFLKSGYIVAVASQTLRINFGPNSYFQYKKTNGEDIDYVSTIEGFNYPTATDVRNGVVYKSGLVTGTLKVPSPADVRKSIPTDNTVGTADITPQDFITALENSNSNIAKRLRNCATVESTGAQLEAYN